MARFVLAGVVALLVTGSAAAAVSPRFVLRDGQTAYFLPGTGGAVRCVVHGVAIDVGLPRVGPAAGSTTGSDLVSGRGRGSVSTETRPNGATRVRCGSATAGSGFFTRLPNPYVIGKNGLALIRGPNRLSVLERIYGRARTAVAGGRCRATWPSIDLVATFAGRCTSDATLTGAVVGAARWGSMNGVMIGDATARMVWEAQGARPLGHGRWLLGSGGTSHHARLVAVTSVGAVVRLVLSGD
jgi:hypothetical protein